MIRKIKLSMSRGGEVYVGTKVADGALLFFTTHTVEDAHDLVVLLCKKGYKTKWDEGMYIYWKVNAASDKMTSKQDLGGRDHLSTEALDALNEATATFSRAYAKMLAQR